MNGLETLQIEYEKLLDTKNSLVEKITKNLDSNLHTKEFANETFLWLEAKLHAAHITILNKNIDGFLALKHDMEMLNRQYTLSFCNDKTEVSDDHQ